MLPTQLNVPTARGRAPKRESCTRYSMFSLTMSVIVNHSRQGPEQYSERNNVRTLLLDLRLLK